MVITGKILTYEAAMLLSEGTVPGSRHSNESPTLESVISEFTHQVTSCNSDQVDAVVETALSNVLAVLKAGRVSWYVNDNGKPYLEQLFSCARPGIAASPARIDKTQIPYTESALAKRETIWIDSAESLPP